MKNHAILKVILKSREVMDELTSSADDNEIAPESLISLHIVLALNKKGKDGFEYWIKLRFNSVRDELTFSADDKAHISESPMWKFNKSCSFSGNQRGQLPSFSNDTQ